MPSQVIVPIPSPTGDVRADVDAIYTGLKNLLFKLRQLNFTTPDDFAGLAKLLSADESDGTLYSNTNAEQILKSVSIPANSFWRLLVETEIKCVNTYGSVSYTFRIKLGTTELKSYTISTLNGQTIVQPLKFTFSGGQTSTVVLNITGQMSVASSAVSMQGLSLRLWGMYA